MAATGFIARVYAFKFLDGFVLIYPLYTVMFAERGLTPSQVAAALMAWSITGFLLQIPSGLLADRWSRRWLLCGAQWVRALGFVVWIAQPGLAGFLLGMVLWGVKSAFTNGTFEALVYDELHAAGRAGDYARIVGRSQGVFAAAVMLTSLLTAVLIRFGYPTVLAASVLLGIVAGLGALALPRAGKTLAVARPHYFDQLARGFTAVARSPVVLGLIAFAALSQAFGGGLEGFWPIFGRQAGLPKSAIALFVAGISAAQVAGAAMAHRTGSRGGAARFYGVFALAGLLLVSAAMVFRPWSAALVVAVAAIFKLVDVSFDAQLHHAIPTESRATIASVKSFAGQIAMTGLLLAFGGLAQVHSYRVAFIGAGGALLAIAAAYGLAGLRPSLAPRSR